VWFVQVCKGVILLAGVGYDSNIYVIDDELLIDTGTGIFFQQQKEKMEKMFDVRKIKKILNTHCHFDHTGGDKKFRDWLKAEIAIHESDEHSLKTGRNTIAEVFGETAKTITVDEVLKNGSLIKTANFSFEVISTPGHTPGSICLYEKNKKILVSGDTLFEDGIGRTDYPGGDKDQLMKSLKKLSKYSINYLLPGHGMPKTSGVNFLIKQVTSSRNDSVKDDI
jgi:glyoxylase-like metal-dependent hydrolase (beta-lactamase superfamily II)